MATRSALELALLLARKPQLARDMRAAPLPPDVTELLLVLSGDADVLAAASAKLKSPPLRVRQAAEFFVEQVLLSRHANSYRILGTEIDAPSPLLRRHMTLLLKWLHPDTLKASEQGQVLEWDVLARRVTKAWDDLKSDERRSVYDRTLGSARHDRSSISTAEDAIKAWPTHERPGRATRVRAALQLTRSQQQQGSSILARIMMALKRRP